MPGCSGIRLAVALGLLCLLPVGASRAGPAGTRRTLAHELVQVSERARRLLGVSLAQGPEVQARLDEWRSRARETGAGLDPDRASARLSRLMFDELAIRREVEDDDLRLMFLPQVVAGRRGSCVGLVSLYLVLAEQMDLPACAVLAPGHLFVRAGPDGARRNIELLRRGESMDDGWYRQKYQVPDGVGAYMRCLTNREFLAVIDYNIGDGARALGHLTDAARVWAGVTAAFPAYPEAHANLGLAHHLRGDLAAATAAYLEALRLHPGLPGLLHNLSLAMLEASYFGRVLELGAEPAPSSPSDPSVSASGPPRPTRPPGSRRPRPPTGGANR